MIILDLILWEGITGLLLIPVVIALVMLHRWMRGRPSFSEAGLGFLVWPSTRKSSLGSPMAQICGALVRRCGHRLSEVNEGVLAIVSRGKFWQETKQIASRLPTTRMRI